MSRSLYHIFRALLGYSDEDNDDKLWKPEDWYPPLCPPEIPKEELLRDVDFTKVDKEARKTEDSLKESFNLLVKHLTSNQDSDLHKLRSIFVWMGHQKVGCRQETAECKNKQSPRFYLQEACKDTLFISKMFAKMCRVAKIPCILVSGKAKGSSYEPGDEDVREESTWAVVHVAGSWRFVFPHWAFVKASGHRKGNWMLVEDSGNALRTRFKAIHGDQISDFNEFFWLTDPEMMQYICYPHDKEHQLLPEPQTKEKFFALPFFSYNYFSSGWYLIDPLTCVIKPKDEWCFIDFCSPTESAKLKYKLFFNENRSKKTFPRVIQIDPYVTIFRRTKQSKSIMVRLPVIGTYKLEVNGGLVQFQIVCEHVPPNTRPLPPCSENGHGFTEEAAAAGLSEPSHTEGVVPVKTGEEIDLSLRVQRDVDILSRLVHSTRTTDDLRDSVRIQRENDNSSFNATLPADDNAAGRGMSQNTVIIQTLLSCSDDDDDDKLWKPEDWYPPLCPPNITKRELLRDVDFTKVDKEARTTEDSLKESFNLLVKHLTSNQDSDLHKLRSIFVWMGHQEIGRRQEKAECKNKQSPRFYLQEACKERSFISKMFAKMCRCAGIPCILVKGKAKGSFYDPGDEDIKAENTWAVVHVAGSWRFMFPHWAFVKASGYQKGSLMLVEDSGSALRTRFTANNGKQVSDFDEFYFLTDPKMMNYICHPHDKEKQLLAEPWTKEKFFTLPFFRSHYFSSGWHLLSPLTCVIKPEDGLFFIDFNSPGAGSKLKYKLLFDETQSGRTFPKEIQMDRYVTILKRTKHTKSVMVRLPEAGTYKLQVTGFHRNLCYRLVDFLIVCTHVAPDIRPLPPCSENGFGFGEEAEAAGLSEPSYTQGVVPVKSGEEIDMSFRVHRDVDILARLVHSTRTTDDLRDSVRIQRENDNATVTATLPVDDLEPEYSLQIDTIKNSQRSYKSKKEFNNPLSYLFTSNKTLNTAIVDESKQKNLQCYEEFYTSVAQNDARLLDNVAFRMAGIEDPILNEKIREQEAKFERMRKEVLAATEERNFDRLNLALRRCMSVNLEYTKDVEDAKKVFLELCKEEVQKAAKSLKLKELRECLHKIATTCIGESVREEVWFKDAQEFCWRLEELPEIKQNLQSLTDDDMANVFKPPDDVIDVIFSTFILLGESQTELNTWQKIWTKLHQTSEKQLFTRLSSFDDSVLTQDRVELAEEKLQHCGRTFGDERVIKTLYSWCLERINFYRLREKLTTRH